MLTGCQSLPCQLHLSQQHGDMQLSDGACRAPVEVATFLAPWFGTVVQALAAATYQKSAEAAEAEKASIMRTADYAAFLFGATMQPLHPP